MRKYLFLLMISISILIKGQNTDITVGMTPTQFMLTINNNLDKYEEMFGWTFVDTLILRDPDYITKLNYNFDTLSTICGVPYDMVAIGQRGSLFRSIVNYNFDRFAGSSYYYNQVATWDTDALAFLLAADISYSDFIIRECTNDHVKDLKAYNLWSKMLAVYPFVGGTAFTHKWNLKDPRNLDAAYRLTFSDGSHSSMGYGVATNGANTYLIPSSVLTKNSKAIFSYIQKTTSTTNRIIYTPTDFYDHIRPLQGNGTTTWNLSNETYDAQTNMFNMGGLWVNTRTTKDTARFYHENSLLRTFINPDTAKYNSSNAYVVSGTPYMSYAGISSGLTPAQAGLLYTVVSDYENCLIRGINQSYPPADSGQYKAKLTVNAVAGDLVTLSLRGKTSMGPTKPVRVYWGNGAMTTLSMDSVSYEVSAPYSVSGVYTMTIMYPEKLDGFGVNAYPSNVALSSDTALVNNIPNVTTFAISSEPRGDYQWTGSLNGLTKLKSLVLAGAWGQDKIMYSGNIENFPDLVTLYGYGDNTLSGSISALTDLTYVYIEGDNTLSGSTTALTKLRQFEGIHGYATVTGELNSDSIGIVCFAELNTLNWDISNKYNFGYLSVGGTATASLHGSVTNDTMLYYIGVGGVGSAVTGSLANLKNLALCYQSNYDKPTRFINNPQLCYFEGNPSYTWSSAEINQLLADLWANRDVFRRPIDESGNYWPNVGGIGGIRYINLQGSLSTGPPTGQGLIDLQNLRNYITPPNYLDTKWTILTR